MGISPFQFQQMQDRLNRSKVRQPDAVSNEGESLESTLHDQIRAHCDSQFPRWKYIHSRMDKRSTIGVGCPDFVVAMPGKVLFIECKRKGGKLSTDQRDWSFEMEKLGHKVHLVTTMEQFLEITKENNQ